jgi:pyrroline-5-carboxylate reductase
MLEFDRRIGIIGIGKMGEALISGLIRSKLIDSAKVGVSDISVERKEYISKKYPITCYSESDELVNNSDIIVIAVKPRDMKKVLDAIKAQLNSNHLLISIAAGISTSFILRHLQKTVSLIRAMPNSPCMIGEGMTVLAPLPGTSIDNIQYAMEIFTSVGKVLLLDEKQLNAVTGLSGSGPAYVYFFIEALTAGGVAVGLPEDVALILSTQTLYGSTKMLFETGESPEKLKTMVATPGGTTVHGLIELESGNVRASIIKAVEKATQRAQQLGLD